MKKAAPLLTPREEKIMRMNQLMSVFAKADSTLAGHRVTVGFPQPHELPAGTPAASNAGHIFFNPDAIKEVSTVEGLVKINGLNYHELAHILFTPQAGTPLGQRVMKAGFHQAFNVLEDQRIETLLVAQFPSVAAYLVATVAEYFLTVDDSQHGKSWPYLYGRKYLPTKMRDYFHGSATAAMAPYTMKRVETVIDDYVALDVHDSNNGDRAFALIELFANLIGTTQQFSPFGHEGATAPASGGQARSGQAGKDAQAAASKAAAATAAEKAEQGDHGQPDTGNGGDSGDQGAGTGTGTGDSDQDGDGSGGDGDSDGQGDGNGGSGHDDGTSDTPGAGAGSGTGTHHTSGTDVLTDVIGSMHQDATVLEDVRRQRDAMGVGRRYKGTLDSPMRPKADVLPSMALQAKRFGQQLNRLVAQSDPGFHTHRSSGRVNVGRAMQGASLDDVFDEWDAGKQDADSIEFVVLVDSSSSMGYGNMNIVNQCAWVIKAGVESVGRNSNVSVIEFGDGARFLWAPGEKAARAKMPTVNASGGTDPRKGIAEAMKIFHASTARRRVFLMLSDGDWDTTANASGHAGIERMKANGIVTASVYLGHASHDLATAQRYYGHQCALFQPITNPGDLLPFAKTLVKAALKS